MAAPILSREDIEQIAGRVLSIYTEAYVPERHLCYQVNPEELADVLGLEVDYQIPSLDGSILGVTSPDEQYVPVYYNGEECYYYLDGNTILIDARLCASPKTVGRKVTDWTEWQADALAAALLMPKDAILDGMFLAGLGEHVGTLSRKYTPNKYDSFCRLAGLLGVSKSALAFRMEHLGLLDKNLLYKQ